MQHHVVVFLFFYHLASLAALSPCHRAPSRVSLTFALVGGGLLCLDEVLGISITVITVTFLGLVLIFDLLPTTIGVVSLSCALNTFVQTALFAVFSLFLNYNTINPSLSIGKGLLLFLGLKTESGLQGDGNAWGR